MKKSYSANFFSSSFGKNMAVSFFALLSCFLQTEVMAPAANAGRSDEATLLPAGWTSVFVSGSGTGTGDITIGWSRLTRANPTALVHCGAGMARYESFTVKPGGFVTLVFKPALHETQ